MSIKSLALLLDTSAVTIRRDLDYLDSVGKLSRTYGRAVAGQTAVESPYADIMVQVIAEKEAIVRPAAHFVQDGDVLIINRGPPPKPREINWS